VKRAREVFICIDCGTDGDFQWGVTAYGTAQHPNAPEHQSIDKAMIEMSTVKPEKSAVGIDKGIVLLNRRTASTRLASCERSATSVL
jgi:hypothetical protein